MSGAPAPTPTPALPTIAPAVNPSPAATTVPVKTYDKPPPMTIDPKKQYFATIKTEKGDIKIELLAEDAAKTVNNFVFLARDGFYNGLKWHRVEPGFVIQGGDPKGNGSGGPGYKFEDEKPIKKDYKEGTVAMANAGPDTNGSQFFITLADVSQRLPKSYTIFGQVIDGMDVVKKIVVGDHMQQVTIEEK